MRWCLILFLSLTLLTKTRAATTAPAVPSDVEEAIQAAVAKLISNLDAKDLQVRQSACENLRRYPDESERQLRGALKKTLIPETRMLAESVLKQIAADRRGGPTFV